MARQLIVHGDADVRDQVSGSLESALGTAAADPRHARNFAHALEVLRTPGIAWSLIVLGSDTPATESSPGRPSDCAPACEFIRTVHRDIGNIPIIALTVNDDSALIQLLLVWDNTAVVKYDWAMLGERARALHDAVRIESTLELEISLQDGFANGNWKLQQKGPVGFARQGYLLINPADFQQLVTLSQGVIPGPKWRTQMDGVSGQLQRVLFEMPNDGLTSIFSQAQAAVGVEKTLLIFTMTLDWQRAMVEALRAPVPATNEYWMLKAPIVRQYPQAGNTRPLFMDDVSRRGAVNCLIINAHPAKGTIEGHWKGDFERLPEICGETKGIETILQAAAAANVGVGKIRRIDLGACTDDFEETVLAAVASDPWHIVHFAGHAFVNGNDQPGLVLHAPSGTVLPFGRLTERLRKTQFLFVSSCKSADRGFSTKVIRDVIPALLGYRWPVDDLAAAKFAAAFYTSLFAKESRSFKSLEHAFVAARNAAYQRDSDDNTWASPLLLTQMRRDSSN